MSSRTAARMAAGLLVAALIGAPAVSARVDLRVVGNTLVDGPGRGHVVTLHGVNRSGLEYACIQGWGFFDSPHPDRIDDRGMIAAMTSWAINAVRVPLNEDCWLGVNAPPRRSGRAYRKIVGRYVRALERAGLYVILDLHWAAPGSVKPTGQLPMADHDHAPAFWRSVARTFKRDRALAFDLFNEPFGIDWRCWMHGCSVRAHGGALVYRTAGMQELVNAVRSTGAAQPLMLGGLDYAGNVEGWVAHVPRDPRRSLVVSEHNYGLLSPCDAKCKAALLGAHRHHPVVIGELGETDCGHSYIDAFMPFADAHGLSYLGWTWDAGGGWTCTGGPALISGYNGTPTAFGIGLRDHLRALAHR